MPLEGRIGSLGLLELVEMVALYRVRGGFEVQAIAAPKISKKAFNNYLDSISFFSFNQYCSINIKF